jgi:hypothetical protein
MVTSLTLAIMFTKDSSGTVLEGMSLPEEIPVESPIDLSTAPAEQPVDGQPSSEEPGSVLPSDEQPSEPATEEGSEGNP